MLHEIFLLLAGHPSPLFTPKLPIAFPLVSPSERALLEQLAHLGILHRSLRVRCDLITSSHPSTIARATASGALANLQQFRSQVSETEKLVLKRDDSVVGAYDIVPLARIVSLFSGWLRILNYLDGLVEYMIDKTCDDGDMGASEQADGQKEVKVEIDTAAVIKSISEKGVHGAKLIDRLRNDIHTGFPSIEKTALELLHIAEMAWLRQVSAWVLYGRLPTFGASDFLVREMSPIEKQEALSDMAIADFVVSKSNTPAFVAPQTASSILFVGRALSQIRVKGNVDTTRSLVGTVNSDVSNLPFHISLLQALTTPLSSTLFHSAISGIRDSLSRNTLQNLLPSEETRDIIHVLREFYLLGRGEFAIALVEQADEKVRGRWRRAGASSGTSAASSVAGLVVKDGEVSGVMKRTWTTLSSFQGQEDHDERLDRAKGLLYLSLKKVDVENAGTPMTESGKGKGSGKQNKTIFNDLLLQVPININFQLTWPLELFLTPQDLDIYESLFHYLLSIRRAQIKLQSLWQSRRNGAVQGIATSSRRAEIKQNRENLVKRERKQRVVWATASLCIFFLESIGVYFQENVIGTSFDTLDQIIGGQASTGSKDVQELESKMESLKSTAGPSHVRTPSSPTKRPSTPRRPQTPNSPFLSPSKSRVNHNSPLRTRSTFPTRPDTPQDSRGATITVKDREVSGQEVDPETLTLAHHQYLKGLYENVFLDDITFTYLLRKFLLHCDIMVTRIATLSKSNETMDALDQDDEHGDEEEEEETKAMDDLCNELRSLLGSLLRRLQEMDDERSRDDGKVRNKPKESKDVRTNAVAKKNIAILEGALSATGIDKLLMKLDLGNLELK